jgi:hypothetical protein
MNCFVVAVREKEDDKIFTLLLTKNDLANLLLHIDENKYDIADIVNTFSEKTDNIIDFCVETKDLETGEGE